MKGKSQRKREVIKPELVFSEERDLPAPVPEVELERLLG